MSIRPERYMQLMEKLSSQFSGFSEDKARAMYKYLKDINPAVLEDGINWCIANERWAPTVEKIKEGCNNARRMVDTKQVINDPINKTHFCARCRGRGQIFAKKKSLGYYNASYSFLCICDASSEVQGGLPTWDDEKHLKYFTIENPTNNELAGRDPDKPLSYLSLVKDLVKTKEI